MFLALFPVLFFGQFSGSLAQDTQMLTFLLNEMTNYRTELNALKADLKTLGLDIATLKTTNAGLVQQNALLNNTVAGLKTKNEHLEKQLVNNISRVESDIVTVDKSTNTSVLFIQFELQLFQKRFEGSLKNVSLEVEYLKRLFNNSTNTYSGCCTSAHAIASNNSLSDLVDRVNNLQSTLNMTSTSVDQIVAQSKDVAFSVMGASGSQFQLSGIVFPKVTTNVGEAYNASSGIFTAPTQGVYMFSLSDLSINNNTVATPFVLNGKRVGGCTKDNYSVGALFSCQAVLVLNVGDQVKTRDFYDGPFHCSTSEFMGWKL